MNKEKQGSYPVVLYDGSCSVCKREIAHYQNRKHAEKIIWIDISSEPDALDDLGVLYEDAMHEFHVRDTEHVWHRGVDGFVYLWSVLPAYEWLSRAVRVLKIQGILEWGYGYFQQWRSRRLCSGEAACRRS